MFLLFVTGFLLFQQEASDALLKARIQQLLHVALMTGDAKQEEAAEAEAKKILLGIHLTQPTPRYSVGVHGGLPSHGYGV